MKRLYEAKDRIEAQLLKDFLAAHHIESVIMGDYLSGATGELPAMQFPVVWVVEDSDHPRGLELLSAFLESADGHDSVQGTWICPHCGEKIENNFVVCWKCGTAQG